MHEVLVGRGGPVLARLLLRPLRLGRRRRAVAEAGGAPPGRRRGRRGDRRPRSVGLRADLNNEDLISCV